MLHPKLLARLRRGSKVIEVGVGGRWDTLETLAHERPDLVLAATDLRPEALEGAPAGVAVRVDDVFDPAVAWYQGAVLLVAVRCPEELQPPLARLARQVGAGLALRVLKDELAAGLEEIVGEPELLQDGKQPAWRVWWPPA